MTKKAAAKIKNAPSNVTIVDGKLIMSLPDAQMPVVWQMDLEKAQSSVFTIQEDKKTKSFTLILKQSNNAVDEIASFDNKQDAVDILMETSSALQNAHGQIKPTTANNSNQHISSPQSDTKGDKTGATLALALIIILGLIWTISASGNLDPNRKTTASSFEGSLSKNARESSGVPVSADDFLSNR